MIDVTPNNTVMPGHSRSEDGVASFARSRSKNGVASLAYGAGHPRLSGTWLVRGRVWRMPFSLALAVNQPAHQCVFPHEAF